MLTLAHQMKILVGAVQQHALDREAERAKQRSTCRSYRIGEANRAVLVALLKRHKRMLSVVEISEKSGMKKHTVSGHLARLFEEGRIERGKCHNFFVYGYKHEHE